MNMDIQISVQIPDFNSSGYIPRSRIDVSCDNSTFHFWGSHDTLFHSGRPILYSHQQFTKVSVSPRLGQHLLLSVYVSGKPLISWNSLCSLWFTRENWKLGCWCFQIKTLQHQGRSRITVSKNVRTFRTIRYLLFLDWAFTWLL